MRCPTSTNSTPSNISQEILHARHGSIHITRLLSKACSDTAGREPDLTFEPSSGTVPARGQLALAVTFAPTVTATSNFNVLCLIKKKPSKLTLNVKGEGYAVHDSLQIEGADGRLVELSPDAPNHLDFGQVCCAPTSSSGVPLGCVTIMHAS